MNKIKKILAGIAISACVGCLAGAMACDKAPKYYDLTFDSANVDILMLGALGELDENGNPFDAISGGKVKAGTEVRFTVSKSSNATGTVTIYVDGVEITPDENGVYSFVIKKNSTVKVVGVSALYQLNLHCGEKVQGSNGVPYYEERMLSYTDLDGNILGDSVIVTEDEDYKFKLNVAPYYVRENSAHEKVYSVICGSQELVADEDGVYTVSNVGDVPDEGIDVYVTGLEQDEPFANRVGCGKGTADSPYLISRPIDMFYIAALTNLAMYNSNYGHAYYKLTADIDMEGAQMFVIGDSSTTESSSPATFGGYFDGNGHTISNFYMTDEVIEQQNYAKAYLPFLGLFGYVAATEKNPVTIKNLTIKNCELRVHTGEAEDAAYAGVLVGYGIGVQVYGCTVENAVITINGSDERQTFAGGIAGVLQAAYGNTKRGIITYDSYVHASNAVNLDLSGTGNLRISGGIVGYMISSDVNAISYISNCTVSGRINGGMQTGGIAGFAGRYASINNCYTSASVSSTNNGQDYADNYNYAYAGGIVGYADEDCVVYASYVAKQNEISANSTIGKIRCIKGDFVGGTSVGGESAKDSKAPLVLNCKTSADGAISSQTDKLGWVEGEWNYSGATPVSKPTTATRTINIGIKAGDSAVVGYSKKVGETRYTMSGWYSSESLPEYVTRGGLRSYGYYFDKELTQRVPYGFVPSANEITLYVGFADYSEVVGEYYVQAATRSNGAYITLSEDGEAIFRNGGMIDSGKYYYDGNKVTIPFSSLSSLMLNISDDNGSKFSFVGTKTADGYGLNFSGIVFVEDTSSDSSSESTVEYNFNAFKKRDNFSYGEYYATSAKISYTFNKGMDGVYTSSTDTRTFTYVFTDENTIKATYTTGGSFTATLSNGVVTKIGTIAVEKRDKFYGTYKHSANSVTSFTFDGLGNVTCNGKSATYEPGQIRAEFEIDEVKYEAFFNQEGYLEINGVLYYPADGFTGEWYFDGSSDGLERIDLALGGISSDGYGYASINYVGGATVSAQYDVVTNGTSRTLRVYSGSMQYGELRLNAQTGVAQGIFYSAYAGAYYDGVTFHLYDNFKGIWVSNEEGIDTVIFSGKAATGANSVTLRSESGEITHGEYKLETSEKGTLTVGAAEYVLLFDEINNKIVLQKKGETGGDDTMLAKRDSWYGTVLYESDGTLSYTFDGKGYIGGKVTVSDGTKLDYTIKNGVVTLNGVQLTPTSDGKGFTYGGKTLVFKTGFKGEWLVGGTMEVLTLTEVGADFTATATYDGEVGEFTFVYNPIDGTLTYIQTVSGQEYVTVLRTNGEYELSLSSTGYTEVSLNCVKADKKDAYMGIYLKGDGSSWTFDGLGNCKIGSGTAVYTATNGDKTNYSYRINKLGIPYISKMGWAFTEAKDGYKFGETGKSYTMSTPDYMYEQLVFTTDASYLFDGFGKLYRYSEDGTYTEAYDYVIVNSTTVTLTDETGVYKGTLTKEGIRTRLTITKA